MCLITDVYDAGYDCSKKEKGYSPEGSAAVALAKHEIACLKLESEGYFAKIQKMRATLELTKRSIIDRRLNMPETMAVIEEALASQRSIKLPFNFG